MPAQHTGIVVGVDVGGTFTDLTLYDPAQGEIAAVKAPSSRAQPDRGVLAALAKAGIGLEACALMVHGTTVGTNALLERDGARVSQVTTEGFRDAVELGRTTRMVPNTLYDPYFKRPPPFVRRRDRHEVRERVRADGSVETPLDSGEVERLAERLAGDGVEAVAVCLLNSYRNPAHERELVERLRQRFEFVCGSAEVLNEIREYERFSTTVVNTYLMPLMGRYCGRLVETLRARGCAAPFYTMASNGGLLSDAMVRSFPVRTVLSGPAAGVAAAAYLMGELGRGHFITYDMGGTSTDVALVADGTWPVKREAVFDGIMIKVPQLDIHSIGAGGGSIAALDAGGSLLVGPESAGAEPGPACYGRGAEQPTVTDANVVLGRIGDGQSLGGSLTVDGAAAQSAVAALGRVAGAAAEKMAAGIVQVAVAKMAAAIYEISIARGHDPRDFTLLPYGGAGPLHACAIAEELGIGRIVVPPAPGTFSAFGGLCSRLFKERMVSILLPLDDAAVARIAAEDAGFRDSLAQEFAAEGLDTARLRFRREIDARYLGQAHEITVGAPDDAGTAAIQAIFEAEFERQFGRLDRDKPVELVNLRVIGEIPVDPPALKAAAPNGTAPEPARRRPVFLRDRLADTPVYRRESFGAGARLSGPLVVEEMSSTALVPPGWSLLVGRYGELHLTKET